MLMNTSAPRLLPSNASVDARISDVDRWIQQNRRGTMDLVFVLLVILLVALVSPSPLSLSLSLVWRNAWIAACVSLCVVISFWRCS